ncbi:AAA family ATPase [Candidatus Gracilibacteria bacterium]|nr:AAA family ATPase [Candidatus Gracilibacteria bacterium]
MRPNISNCHALPGTLLVFEGADGSGKTTQVKTLKKMLEKAGHEVTVSSWKTAPILGDFLKTNESLKKFDERILPETSLFMQSADLLYRIEREVIPAMKRGHIVILDRGLHTLIVRGLMIGMTEDQLRNGLLWWRNSIYKELFDKAHTIHITVESETSLTRLTKRAYKERQKLMKKGEKKDMDGTLLTLHFINTLVYAPDGKKMTRQDKKAFIRKTQSQIIVSYTGVFQNEKHKALEMDGNQKTKDIALILKNQVLEMII